MSKQGERPKKRVLSMHDHYSLTEMEPPCSSSRRKSRSSSRGRYEDGFVDDERAQSYSSVNKYDSREDYRGRTTDFRENRRDSVERDRGRSEDYCDRRQSRDYDYDEFDDEQNEGRFSRHYENEPRHPTQKRRSEYDNYDVRRSRENCNESRSSEHFNKSRSYENYNERRSSKDYDKRRADESCNNEGYSERRDNEDYDKPCDDDDDNDHLYDPYSDNHEYYDKTAPRNDYNERQDEKSHYHQHQDETYPRDGERSPHNYDEPPDEDYYDITTNDDVQEDVPIYNSRDIIYQQQPPETANRPTTNRIWNRIPRENHYRRNSSGSYSHDHSRYFSEGEHRKPHVNDTTDLRNLLQKKQSAERNVGILDRRHSRSQKGSWQAPHESIERSEKYTSATSAEIPVPTPDDEDDGTWDGRESYAVHRISKLIKCSPTYEKCLKIRDKVKTMQMDSGFYLPQHSPKSMGDEEESQCGDLEKRNTDNAFDPNVPSCSGDMKGNEMDPEIKRRSDDRIRSSGNRSRSPDYRSRAANRLSPGVRRRSSEYRPRRSPEYRSKRNPEYENKRSWEKHSYSLSTSTPDKRQRRSPLSRYRSSPERNNRPERSYRNPDNKRRRSGEFRNRSPGMRRRSPMNPRKRSKSPENRRYQNRSRSPENKRKRNDDNQPATRTSSASNQRSPEEKGSARYRIQEQQREESKDDAPKSPVITKKSAPLLQTPIHNPQISTPRQPTPFGIRQQATFPHSNLPMQNRAYFISNQLRFPNPRPSILNQCRGPLINQLSRGMIANQHFRGMMGRPRGMLNQNPRGMLPQPIRGTSQQPLLQTPPKRPHLLPNPPKQVNQYTRPQHIPCIPVQTMFHKQTQVLRPHVPGNAKPVLNLKSPNANIGPPKKLIGTETQFAKVEVAKEKSEQNTQKEDQAIKSNQSESSTGETYSSKESINKNESDVHNKEAITEESKIGNKSDVHNEKGVTVQNIPDESKVEKVQDLLKAEFETSEKLVGRDTLVESLKMISQEREEVKKQKICEANQKTQTLVPIIAHVSNPEEGIIDNQMKDTSDLEEIGNVNVLNEEKKSERINHDLNLNQENRFESEFSDIVSMIVKNAIKSVDSSAFNSKIMNETQGTVAEEIGIPLESISTAIKSNETNPQKLQHDSDVFNMALDITLEIVNKVTENDEVLTKKQTEDPNRNQEMPIEDKAIQNSELLINERNTEIVCVPEMSIGNTSNIVNKVVETDGIFSEKSTEDLNLNQKTSMASEIVSSIVHNAINEVESSGDDSKIMAVLAEKQSHLNQGIPIEAMASDIVLTIVNNAMEEVDVSVHAENAAMNETLEAFINETIKHDNNVTHEINIKHAKIDLTFEKSFVSNQDDSSGINDDLIDQNTSDTNELNESVAEFIEECAHLEPEGEHSALSIIDDLITSIQHSDEIEKATQEGAEEVIPKRQLETDNMEIDDCVNVSSAPGITNETFGDKSMKRVDEAIPCEVADVKFEERKQEEDNLKSHSEEPSSVVHVSEEDEDDLSTSDSKQLALTQEEFKKNMALDVINDIMGKVTTEDVLYECEMNKNETVAVSENVEFVSEIVEEIVCNVIASTDSIKEAIPNQENLIEGGVSNEVHENIVEDKEITVDLKENGQKIEKSITETNPEQRSPTQSDLSLCKNTVSHTHENAEIQENIEINPEIGSKRKREPDPKDIENNTSTTENEPKKKKPLKNTEGNTDPEIEPPIQNDETKKSGCEEKKQDNSANHKTGSQIKNQETLKNDTSAVEDDSNKPGIQSKDASIQPTIGDTSIEMNIPSPKTPIRMTKLKTKSPASVQSTINLIHEMEKKNELNASFTVQPSLQEGKAIKKKKKKSKSVSPVQTAIPVGSQVKEKKLNSSPAAETPIQGKNNQVNSPSPAKPPVQVKDALIKTNNPNPIKNNLKNTKGDTSQDNTNKQNPTTKKKKQQSVPPLCNTSKTNTQKYTFNQDTTPNKTSAPKPEIGSKRKREQDPKNNDHNTITKGNQPKKKNNKKVNTSAIEALIGMDDANPKTGSQTKKKKPTKTNTSTIQASTNKPTSEVGVKRKRTELDTTSTTNTESTPGTSQTTHRYEEKLLLGDKQIVVCNHVLHMRKHKVPATYKKPVENLINVNLFSFDTYVGNP